MHLRSRAAPDEGAGGALEPPFREAGTGRARVAGSEPAVKVHDLEVKTHVERTEVTRAMMWACGLLEGRLGVFEDVTDAEFGSAETLAVTSVRLVATEHTEVDGGQLASPGEQEMEENKARDEKGPNFLTKTNAIRVNPLPAHQARLICITL